LDVQKPNVSTSRTGTLSQGSLAIILISYMTDDIEARIQRLSPLNRSEDPGKPSRFDDLAAQRSQPLVTEYRMSLLGFNCSTSRPSVVRD
jgi:hypothetical protein